MPSTPRGKTSSVNELSAEALDQVVGGATAPTQQPSDRVGQDALKRATQNGMMAEGPNERMPPDW